MIQSDINDRVIFDLIVVDRASHEERVAAHGILMNYAGAWVRWSPDGQRLAYVGGPLPEGPQGPSNRTVRSAFAVPGYVYVVPANAGASRQMGDRAVATRNALPIWDARGQVLYAAGSDTLWRFDVESGVMRPAAGLDGSEVVSAPGLTFPDAFSGSVALPTSHAAVLIHGQDGRRGLEGLYSVDVGSGAVRTLFESRQQLGAFAIATASDAIVYQAEDVKHPADIWLVGRRSSGPVQLTHVNPKLEQTPLGNVQRVSWQSLDGDSVRGVLLLPSDYVPGRRYPTVTWVYAGEDFGTRWQNSFGILGWINATYNCHLLATRGYVVFVPDVPVHMGTPMADIAKVVLPGINQVIELGITDPDHLGLWGHSHGGYTALSLLVQARRFRAAIIGATGPSDLFTEYELLYPNGSDAILGWAEQGQGRMGGSPWEYRDRYLENSPFFYLDRVATPVLIEYGSVDYLAPFSKSAFVALRRLDKRVELIDYEGEDHVVLSPANQIDYWRRAIAWFDEHLRGGRR